MVNTPYILDFILIVRIGSVKMGYGLGLGRDGIGHQGGRLVVAESVVEGPD